MAFVLGVTGSIATGKSSVVEIFASYGFPIIDGDKVAREIVEPGCPALAAIVTHFGQEMLLPNGELNRQALGQLIFSQPTKRQELDRLLDPFLRQTILGKIAVAKEESPLVIADIPLLFEGGYEGVVDQVAVVYLPQEIQKKRLMLRDRLTETEAMQRIASQMSIEEKKTRGDLIFDNQGSPLETQKQVIDWLKGQHFI